MCKPMTLCTAIAEAKDAFRFTWSLEIPNTKLKHNNGLKIISKVAFLFNFILPRAKKENPNENKKDYYAKTWMHEYKNAP